MDTTKEELHDAVKALDKAHQDICCREDWDKKDPGVAKLIHAAYEVVHLIQCHIDI